MEKKKENKYAPLLFNLAELQNECSRLFKQSPDETLRIVQELYEKKLVTYPRTDARVLSTAVAKEIHKNIGGLKQIPGSARFCGRDTDRRPSQGAGEDQICERQADHGSLCHRAHRTGNRRFKSAAAACPSRSMR